MRAEKQRNREDFNFKSAASATEGMLQQLKLPVGLAADRGLQHLIQSQYDVGGQQGNAANCATE